MDGVIRPRATSQSGVTLIELVMAIAVGGILLAAVTMSIVTLLNTNTRNSNHMVAVRNVQNAGYWVSRDAECADAGQLPDGTNGITPTGANGFPLYLRWTDPETMTDIVACTYTLQPDGAGTYTLWRTIGGTSTSVAQHIIGDNTTKTSVVYDTGGRRLTFTVTATMTTRNITGTETRVYNVAPRPGAALMAPGAPRSVGSD